MISSTSIIRSLLEIAFLQSEEKGLLLRLQNDRVSSERENSKMINHPFTVEAMFNENWEDSGSAVTIESAINIAAVAAKLYGTPVRILENNEVVFRFSNDELWN